MLDDNSSFLQNKEKVLDAQEAGHLKGIFHDVDLSALEEARHKLESQNKATTNMQSKINTVTKIVLSNRFRFMILTLVALLLGGIAMSSFFLCDC